MEIKKAEFISSMTDVAKGPQDNLPEFAFIGRSNVGKSSLINMLTGNKHLAKTSGKPGKTQTINHFKINDAWYIVDLPGYGYASVSKEIKQGFGKIIDHYIQKSTNLYCLFVLIDCRLEPQPIDLRFINWIGSQGIPMAIVFTKTDKISKNKINTNKRLFEITLKKDWEEAPAQFLTSAVNNAGKAELLDFINSALTEEN
jgi:GTP-binding protein